MFWQALLRFLHVLSGIMWIGLLYYFNFVQIPQMANIPAEQKPAVSKFIAPAALFWFRWAALSTFVFGVLIAINRGYLLQAVTLDAVDGFKVPQYTFIGMGMWLATIMFLNVWGIIWPNQKRALGIVEATPEVKAKAARVAMLASRTNTLLSIPMLYHDGDEPGRSSARGLSASCGAKPPLSVALGLDPEGRASGRAPLRR